MNPLKDVLVISLEQAVAAPYCTARLVDAGARVIKIERHDGDFARRYDTAAKNDSSYFAWLNQGKESVCLDIKTEPDKSLFRSLLNRADIFVQNLAPGAIERAGFNNDALRASNPKLIICNISGYGYSAAVSGKRGYDLLIQAESGLISVSGSPEEPSRIGVSICDIGTGMTAYYGVLEALLERKNSGRGNTFDVSLFDVAVDWLSVPFIHTQYGKGTPQPSGLRHPSIAPYGAFYCRDERAVLISIQNEREWKRFCEKVLQTPELASNTLYETNDQRVQNRETLELKINTITNTITSAEFTKRLDGADIAYGLINTMDDLPKHPAFRSRYIRNTDGQQLSIPATPIVWRQKAELRSTRLPRIGEHTSAIREEFSSK